jgi:hypothetical protein
MNRFLPFVLSFLDIRNLPWRFLSFVLGPLGFTVQPTSMSKLLDSYVTRLEETTDRLQDDIISLRNEQIETAIAVRQSIRNSGAGYDIEPSLSLADVVASALAQSVSDNSRQRVNAMLDVIRRTAEAAGITEDHKLSPDDLVEAVESMQQLIKNQRHAIAALTSFEVLQKDEEIKVYLWDTMVQFFYMVLNGDMAELNGLEKPAEPAPNHVAMTFRGNGFEDIEVVVRRINGKTDTQLKDEAQAELRLFKEFHSDIQKMLDARGVVVNTPSPILSEPFSSDEHLDCNALRPLPTTLDWLDDDAQCAEFCREIVRGFGFDSFAFVFARDLTDKWHHAAMSVTSMITKEAAVIVNAKTWLFSDAEFRYFTLIHESCHVIAGFMSHGQSKAEQLAWLGPDGHGPLWLSLMETCGAPPSFRHDKSFYHREDVLQSLFPRRPLRADCPGCQGVFPLSPGMTKKALTCTTCPDTLLQPRDLPPPTGYRQVYKYP